MQGTTAGVKASQGLVHCRENSAHNSVAGKGRAAALGSNFIAARKEKQILRFAQSL
jgi:hypothetical protein